MKVYFWFFSHLWPTVCWYDHGTFTWMVTKNMLCKDEGIEVISERKKNPICDCSSSKQMTLTDKSREIARAHLFQSNHLI